MTTLCVLLTLLFVILHVASASDIFISVVYSFKLFLLLPRISFWLLPSPPLARHAQLLATPWSFCNANPLLLCSQSSPFLPPPMHYALEMSSVQQLLQTTIFRIWLLRMWQNKSFRASISVYMLEFLGVNLASLGRIPVDLHCCSHFLSCISAPSLSGCYPYRFHRSTVFG